MQPPPLTLFQRICIIPEGKLYPLSSYFPFLPTPSTSQQPVCFLSLWIYPFWVFCINGITQYIIFYVWLLSLGIMFSRFLHIVACISTSFLSVAEWYYCMYILLYFVCICHNLSIHSSVDGYLGYFYLLAGVNSAAMNMHVHVFALQFGGSIPRSEIAWSNANSMLNFLRNCQTAFYSSWTILYAH